MSKSKPKAKIVKFKPSQIRITLTEFSSTHAGGIRYPSDTFYVGIANKIYPIIYEALNDNPSLSPAVFKRIAITLAGYLEDLVSGCGVWAAFTSLHQKKYGTKMPFFNVEDDVEEGMIMPYDDELPSLRAVQFMIWDIINSVKPDVIINPQNPAIGILSLGLMPILLEGYDDAPESPARPVLISEGEFGIPIFYQIRNLCEWLCTGCYLTRIFDRDKVEKPFIKFMKTIVEKGRGEDDQIDYAREAYIPMNTRIGPLALPAYEWLAEIVDLYHEDEEKPYIHILKEMKSRPYETYQYKSINGDKAILLNTAGEEMTMSATTLPGERFAKEITPGSSAIMSLICYDGAWVMNSLALQPLPPELYEEAHKEYIKRRDDNEKNYSAILKKLRKRIGVVSGYEEYMDKLHAGSKEDWHDMLKRNNVEIPEDLRDADNLVYFVNTDSTVSMLINWGGCIKLRGNKLYDKQEAMEDAITLIFDHSISTKEFRDYIVETNLIPDAALASIISPKVGKELFQKNIRFFNDYTYRDSINITG